TAALTQIQISPAALALPRGTSAPLTAVGVFSDGSHVDLTPQVTWSSSAPATASVSATGAVTAVATGAATITASLDGKTASVPVTVSAAAIASLAIDPPSPTVALLQTVALTATGTFSDGSTLDVSQQAIWTSSDPLTALVSNLDGARGRVTGLVAGTATITATVGSASASVTITVTPAVLVSAAIQPAALTLPSGLSAPLAVIGTLSDGTTADLTAQATFSSTDPIVAAVASDGLVTAGAAGTATVTAHVGTVNASVVVSSVAASLQQLQVTPTQLGLPRGTTAQLAAVGVFSDGSHQDVTTLVTWTTSAPAIASVGNLITAGKVTAIAVGTATLTATLGTTHTDVPVTVSAASLGSLAIDPPAPAVGLGQTTQLTATGTFSDSSTADVSQQATWTSSNPLVAAVSNVDGTRGKVTGLLAGSATITATIGAATASVAVTVSPATLVAATISPAVLTLPNGLAQQVAVNGLFSDGTTHDVTAQAVFSSSTPAIASVSTTGTVTARAPGAALITVAIGGVTAALPVTVTPAVLQQVQVAPSVLTLPRGTAAPLTATGVFSDGSHADITGLVTWTSSATAVASVSNVLLSAGRVTGNAVGDATISATLAGVAGTAAVHVGNATLTSIAVSGADVLVPIGLTQQLTATGTFSDGTTADVTAQATWASDSAVVVVSNVAGARGLATAVAIGSATVTATVGTVSGSTTVGTTGASLLSIDIPSVPALPLGLTAQLTASGHFSDGSVVDVTGQVAWSSTSPAIGAVSATGVVSALGLGTATVQASLGGVTGTQTIGISAAVLQVLVVTPAVVSLPVGLGQGLIATATFSDGSLVDVTTQVTWSSDHSNVATVTNVGAQGVVTAIAPGTATITAQKGTITAHAAVIVTPAVLTSIAVNSGQAASIALGQIAQLTATGNFSDGTTADLTSQVAWTSSAPTALAVSNLPGSQGRVTALAAGAATITATSALTGVAGATGVSVAAGCHVVINELKTGAVLSTSDEFIELFNPCSFDVDLSHESLVYRTLAGVIDITLNTLTGTLPAGGYRVYGGTAYGGSVSGTFSTDLPALGGGIAVRDANVLYDSLGYGIAVNLFVEGAVSLQVPAGQTLARIPNGRDTNNNAADFQIRTPTPGAANQ
ncbi:MAG TPA: Ig-like domain-containing protein, partial [Kofleriaceae bacterium]|nr:Ig-like domain-containing protein [Kofleriaceae bacterium]